MNTERLDLLIIADKGGYENMAFRTGLSELTLDGQTMTIQNLMRYFARKAGSAGNRNYENVELTRTGKLNGILLYDYATRHGLSCDLLDSPDPAQLREAAARAPRCVAISTTWILSKREALPVVQAVRAAMPDAYLVVGGPLILNSQVLHQFSGSGYDTESARADYFFVDPDEAEQCRAIDLFVAEQQGEYELVEICLRLRTKRDPRDTVNCAFYANGKLVWTPRSDQAHALDESLVRWDMLPDRLVPEIAPIRVSTGCPFRCAFCNFVHRKRIMRKSKAVLREEIRRLLTRKHVKHLRLVDDTLSTRDLRELCEIFRDEGMTIPWTSFARADSIRDGVAGLLRETHCTSVQLGLESGDDTVLKAMNKHATTELYRTVLADLAAEGITTRASFILGHPGETDETAANTFAFLKGLRYEGDGLFEYLFAPFFLVPLSPLYAPAERAKYGLSGYMARWEHATMRFDQVPPLMARAFLAAGDNVFFAYVQDDVLPALPRPVLRQVKQARQRARQAQLRVEQGDGTASALFAGELAALEGLLLPHL